MNIVFFKTKQIHVNPEKVRNAIVNYLTLAKQIGPQDPPSLSEEIDFQKDLGMDSMDIAELVIHLERVFKIDFYDADKIPPLHTLGRLTDFTYRLLNP